MKEGEVTEMMANLRKRQGKPSKPSQEALDASWFSDDDFGLLWHLDTTGLWVYDSVDDEWKLATKKQREILQDAPMLVALRRGQNEK